MQCVPARSSVTHARSAPVCAYPPQSSRLRYSDIVQRVQDTEHHHVKYRRLGRTEYADLLESAAQAHIDSIQAATLWRECPPIDDDAKYERLEALAGQIDKQPVAA